MRTMIAAVAALAVATTAPAQTTAYQDEVLNYGQKQVLVNEKSQNFQNARISYLDGDKSLKAKADTFNGQAGRLQDEREQWLGRNQIYDNVISLRSKDKVMAALDEARKKLGVSELEGYQRLGVYNPFTGESYVKYFDLKTGELVIGEVRALYKNLDQAQQDFQKGCDRLRADESQISQDYQKVLDGYKAARDAKQAKDQAVEELAKAAESRDKARARDEAERQRLQQAEAAERERNRPRPSNVLP